MFLVNVIIFFFGVSFVLNSNDDVYSVKRLTECPECKCNELDKCSWETSCTDCGLVIESAYPYTGGVRFVLPVLDY